MPETRYSRIIRDGLWTNNPGLVQLLGLCPLLATSSTVINGLGLGLATTLTLILSNGIISAIRNQLRPEIRIPVFVLVIASVVTVIELIMNAWYHDLYRKLGIFIPLIVTNCAIIGRAEAFASRNSIDRALVDGLTMGAGFTLVLVTLGGIREILGQGTLLSHANLLFGEAARNLTITIIPDFGGFLLAILPPGAFFALGLLVAIKNIVDARNARRAETVGDATPALTAAT